MEIVAVSSLFGTGSGGQKGALGALGRRARVRRGAWPRPQAWACSWPENEAGTGGFRRVPPPQNTPFHTVFSSYFRCLFAVYHWEMKRRPKVYNN